MGIPVDRDRSFQSHPENGHGRPESAVTIAGIRTKKQKFVDFNLFVLKIMGMSTIKSTFTQEDMHPADVIAALHKRGTSLRKIAIENGYSHIQRVLTSPWLAAEQLVAKALNRKPEDLWPSRYLNPADRALAFQLTRKIAVTMPHQRKQQPRKLANELPTSIPNSHNKSPTKQPHKITADCTGHSLAEPDVNHG